MNWSAADVEKANKPKGAPATATKRAAPTPVPPAASEARQREEKAKGELPALPPPTAGTYPGPATWLLHGGRVSLSLPRQLDADRTRLVVCFPTDPGLLAALLAAAEAHVSKS